MLIQLTLKKLAVVPIACAMTKTIQSPSELANCVGTGQITVLQKE